MPKTPAKGRDAGAQTEAPAVILFEPQLGENIGFAARAMANFGLSELRLVAPRDGWPNDKARAAAAGAAAVIDAATLYPNLEAAIADLNFLLATTARPQGHGEAGDDAEARRGRAREAVRAGRAHRRSVRARAERARQ